MPWIPTTDFEEEVVSLQPDHDFIYGVLSEPEYTYPRPKAHTEYAAHKKKEVKDHRKSTTKINGKLHAIQQVQRMANTKPVGEQPTLDDWENNRKIEQETIGMMRYCGMGVSLEQPLNPKVTIATYPVENKIKLVQNGRRKVALYFDDNVFKLKEKVSDTSSGFDSCNNSTASEFRNGHNDSLVSELETSCNDSFVSTTSSLALNSFSTAGDNSDTFSTASSSSNHIKAQRFQQYQKLLEDTALLSLNCSNSSDKQNADSFETAQDIPRWRPISDEEENIFDKAENWPGLGNNKYNNHGTRNTPYNKSNSDSADDVSSVTSTTTTNSSSSSNQSKRTNFLDRFIKPENCNDLNTCTDTSTSNTSASEPSTYATITKTSKHLTQTTPKQKESKNNSANDILDFQPFYTTRRMYALKRHVK